MVKRRGTSQSAMPRIALVVSQSGREVAKKPEEIVIPKPALKRLAAILSEGAVIHAIVYSLPVKHRRSYGGGTIHFTTQQERNWRLK